MVLLANILAPVVFEWSGDPNIRVAQALEEPLLIRTCFRLRLYVRVLFPFVLRPYSSLVRDTSNFIYYMYASTFTGYNSL